MAELVADCPRCGASRITFDLVGQVLTPSTFDWQSIYETFCICRHCRRTTVCIVAVHGFNEQQLINKSGLAAISGVVNGLLQIQNFVSLKDQAAIEPPAHLPEEIRAVFSEGATCLAVGCFNAAGTMFRLSVDLATKSLLPEDGEGLNSKVRRNLGLRLHWLFDHHLLLESLRELSSCIKEDGNGGAHDGSLKKEDAEDLLDFTTALLERLYTEPERLRLAKERREQRRNS